MFLFGLLVEAVTRISSVFFISLFQSAVGRGQKNSVGAYLCANERTIANVSSLVLIQGLLLRKSNLHTSLIGAALWRGGAEVKIFSYT